MARLGVADAERGEVNPFYYQHYYPYRRAYDRTRRRLRQPALIGRGRQQTLALLLAVLVLGSLLAGVFLNRRSQASMPAAQALTAATNKRATPIRPTATPIFPTATPVPPTPVVLHTQGRAVVSNLQGRTLRARATPSANAPVQAAFQEGDQVTLLEGPVEADGYVWWRVEGERGSGWSAQQSPEGQVWLQPLAE